MFKKIFSKASKATEEEEPEVEEKKTPVNEEKVEVGMKKKRFNLFMLAI